MHQNEVCKSVKLKVIMQTGNEPAAVNFAAAGSTMTEPDDVGAVLPRRRPVASCKT